ncbi:hypothetical protein QQ045_022939 [Rhodiola kirilowii]
MTTSSVDPASQSPSGINRNEGDGETLKGLVSTEKKKSGCIYGLLKRKPNKEKAKLLCKKWFEEPLNVALFVWLCVVAVCAIAFFLSLTGTLDKVLRKQSFIDLSFEVPNQILNALFTLLCIYMHPKRFYHLFLLCRWRPEDVTILRKEYCKDGSRKHNERTNMIIVVVLLHVNCFAQYALCGLNMGLKKSDRPVPVLATCLVVSVAAPITAVIYMNQSSLGQDHEQVLPADVEAQSDQKGHKIERNSVSVSKKELKTVEEKKPKWVGSLANICEDKSAASLSFFCCFCVFGWNMERLGLGNMYVHITTFLLICTSPVWIFYLASARIENEAFSRGMQLLGVLLSLLGLLHGGIWRIKMRKKYNLPPDDVCCAKPALADCAKWLFCCWCSLAQELRTANYYDTVEDTISFPKAEVAVGSNTEADRTSPAKDAAKTGSEIAMAAPVISVIQKRED